MKYLYTRYIKPKNFAFSSERYNKIEASVNYEDWVGPVLILQEGRLEVRWTFNIFTFDPSCSKKSKMLLGEVSKIEELDRYSKKNIKELAEIKLKKEHIQSLIKYMK